MECATPHRNTGRGVIIVVACGLVATSSAIWLLRDRGANAWIHDVTRQLRQLHKAVVLAHHEVGNSPSSSFILVYRNYVSPEIFIAPGSSTTASTIPIGTKTWGQLTADFDNMAAFLQQMPQRDAGWECLGDFYFAPDAWQRPEANEVPVVLAVSRSSPYQPESRVVVYNDGATEQVAGDAWRGRDNEARGALGRPQLPPVPGS